MLALKESYAAPVEADLLRLFWEVFYMPIVAAAKVQGIRTNAAEMYLIAAIKSGKVKYADGKFSGDFDVRTSRELSSFASFNRRSKIWTGNPSPAIKAASILADTHRRELQARLEKAIDAAEANINQAVRSLSFGSDLPISEMAGDIKKDLYSVGVMPEIDARTEKMLREQYTNNMRLNIVDETDSSKGWAPEQISRLRDMVKENQTTGTNESLRALIEREWDTSRAKARFLATQETRLFLDTLSRDRARRTGVRRYRWSTSHDEKVRDSHKLLDGKIVDIDGPGEIVDQKTGRRAHAGADFGCFPGYMLASSSGLEKAYKREYSGLLLRIKTASGLQIDVTPNHPILTDKGWIAANLIEKGSNILGMRHRDMGNLVDVDIENGPPMLSKIFDFPGVALTKERAGGSNEQFHGDGSESEIEIVSFDRHLRDRVEANGNKHFSKLKLTLAEIASGFLFHLRSMAQLFYRARNSAMRVMGRLSKSHPFLDGSLGHSDVHTLASVADMNTMFAQNAIDSPALYPETARDSLAGFSRDVFSDKVELVDSFYFRGHVYNLQTSDGWYIVSNNGKNVNGIIVHNCRCNKIWVLE